LIGLKLTVCSGVTLTVPDGAVRKGCAQTIFVAVLRDDKDRPKLSGEISSAIEVEMLRKPISDALPPSSGRMLLALHNSSVKVVSAADSDGQLAINKKVLRMLTGKTEAIMHMIKT
jgi:hypothetical protein